MADLQAIQAMEERNHSLSWYQFTCRERLVQAALARILRAAEAAIEARGEFSIVLAGGSTPAVLYRELAACDADWRKWKIYFGDERCLPVGDADRNSTMAAENWLDQVNPAPQVFMMPAELGADAGAHAYSATIRDALPFDIVLLGAGEDGHTASLFPGHDYPAGELAHAEHHSPKPPAARVTLAYDTLCSAAQVMFLVTGSNKAEIVSRWRNGEDLPVTRVYGMERTHIYLDSGAAGV